MAKILKKLTILIPVLVLNGCGDLEFNESEANESSHYPGTDCGACHGTQAKNFTLAGTVYSDAAGTAPASGKVIIVRNISGTELFRLTTDKTGNFFTNTTVVYPLKLESTSGKAMTNSIDFTGHSCNQAGCHDSARRLY